MQQAEAFTLGILLHFSLFVSLIYRNKHTSYQNCTSETRDKINTMKVYNQAQVRLFTLLNYLFCYSDEKHPVSSLDILKHWRSKGINASRKSVYNDIALLVELGIDIVCIKSTQNLYFIGSRLFELPELKLLVDAVESSHFITPKKSRVLIQKLGRLASNAQAAQLNRPIYMDGTVKSDNEAIYYIVDTLQTAIHERKQVSFQYYEYLPTKVKVLKHGGYRYQFSPYALIWNQDFYYVVGWSEKHDKIAQFRVDRITGIALLDLSARQTPGFDPAAYGQKVFGMYPDNLQTVTLLCKNRLMRSVIDQFGEDVRTRVVDDDHFLATVEVAPSPPFFAWVFTFAGEIRIVSPANVLEEMKKMARWLQ